MKTFSYYYVAPMESLEANVAMVLEAAAMHSFAALVGENGLVQVHRSSFGDIGCVFMRDRVVLDRETCASLVQARAWLQVQIPRLGALRAGERP